MLKLQHNLRRGSRTLFCSTVNGFCFSTLRSSKLQSSRTKSSPLAVFFAQYRNFDYNSAKSATNEFRRLCKSNDWNRNDFEENRTRFRDALTMQFNDNYGTDVNDITNWQALCARLKMDPVPENLKSCRKAVRSKHVNLVDLVDNFSTEKSVRIFPTALALSEYTNENERYFPRDNVHAGSLLKFLLRHILNPALDRYRNERRRRTRTRTRM